MDVPIQSCPRRKLGVDIGEKGGGEPGGDDDIDERVDSRGEEEFVYM